jgi:hypothetical protein
MQCSVGVKLSEMCDSVSYGKRKEVKDVDSLPEDSVKLLKLRVSDDIIDVCTYHRKKYLDNYTHLFGRTCCDPYTQHKKIIRKSLRKISLAMAENNRHLRLTPGKSLCSYCYNKVSKESCTSTFVPSTPAQDVLNYSMDSVASCSSFQQEEVLQSVNVACSALGVSAIKLKKLSQQQRPAAAKRKVERVCENLLNKIHVGLSLDIEDVHSESDYKDSDDELIELINRLKTKFESVSCTDDKVKILSLIPKSWSIEKICSEFNTSAYMVKLTRKLVREQGILPNTHQITSSLVISQETIDSVVAFYESEDASRICPGKKDCVSVRNKDGKKEHVQKRLVLMNLKELHAQFKNAHPNMKVGFSKFAELRPKWCVLAGASGTHSVCVCCIHQNAKLMVNALNLQVTYKELLGMLVCDMNQETCMLYGCDECPSSDALRDRLLATNDDDDESIKYKQWVTTDRCDLVTVIEPLDDFVEKLVEKLLTLKTHHYVSIQQSEFLKTKRSQLKREECIISGDFSENFTFVVQDEIQSYHWVNAQATLHPFVIYYRPDSSTDVVTKSYCIISDYLKHSTTAVYSFQKAIIPELKSLAPHVTTILYFSDGAASQYKNRKNFANLCHHFNDFGLHAEWHFHATSHGKGPCDGIGGTVKRLVTKSSLQRTGEKHILTPTEMFEYCKDNIKGVTFIFVSSSFINSEETALNERYKHAKVIQNTRENHCFIPIDNKSVKVYRTSSSAEYKTAIIS